MAKQAPTGANVFVTLVWKTAGTFIDGKQSDFVRITCGGRICEIFTFTRV